MHGLRVSLRNMRSVSLSLRRLRARASKSLRLRLRLGQSMICGWPCDPLRVHGGTEGGNRRSL
jgi:hypothetical protein